MSDTNASHSGDGITLRDVIFHIQGVKQSLEGRIDSLEQKMDRRFERVEDRLDRMEIQLDGLTKDRDAVVWDIIEIKQHVGMPVQLD